MFLIQIKIKSLQALSCDCIDNNNLYNNEKSCSHGVMISDSHFVNYIYKVIDDPKEEDIITSDRINAVYNFKNKLDYENKCNEDLIQILESDV